MLIRNRGALAAGARRTDCLAILEAGLQAADPARIIPRFVTPGGIPGAGVRFADHDSVHLVAFGKAGDAMARAFNAVRPVRGGLVVIPRGTRSVLRGSKFRIFNSGHPVPDQASVRAGREALKFVSNRRPGELVVFLVSGGGSALMALPDGVALDDKIRATELLLRSGAPIREVNCVRKHLSAVKGGGLVRDMKCTGVGLVMSDVEGDSPADVASGPTQADPSTYADALAVIDGRGLARRMPPAVLAALEGGEDAPPGGPEVRNIVVANNMTCLGQMRAEAERLGYGTSVMQVFGDVRDAAAGIVGRAPAGPGRCLVFGGEPTVRVLGRGTGGRNQELVLRLLKNTQGMPRMAIASMGTDGIDGNSPYAGAITENAGGDTRAMRRFLRDSDSARFFQKRGENIETGPTHTNLMDIGVVLR